MSPEEGAAKTPTTFQLEGVYFLKAVFEAVIPDGFVAQPDRPVKVNVELTLGAQIKFLSDLKGAFVELEVNVVPDQQWQPYNIVVRIVGVFRSSDATPDELNRFTRVAAPTIL